MEKEGRGRNGEGGREGGVGGREGGGGGEGKYACTLLGWKCTAGLGNVEVGQHTTGNRACNSTHIVKRGIQTANKSLIGCYMLIHVFYSLLLIRKGKQ